MRGALAVIAALVLLTTLAVAGGKVASWTDGQVAVQAARVLGGLPEPVEIPLPESVAAQIEGPTFLVYFSPTCPHCQHAQPELNEVARAVRGKASFLGIASASATPELVAEFQRKYKVAYPIMLDADRSIVAALSARSTPSVLLVERVKKRIVAKDAWYPYRQGTSTLLRMAVADAPFSVFEKGVYHGSGVCIGCHLQEGEGWMLSHHSVAWDTLLQRDADTKAECVGCHVTGHGQPNGWTPGGPDSLTDVGCEACHGPGGPHDGERAEATEACATCHDAKHSIAFSVAKGLPHIDHFAGNGLDPDSLRDRLRALHSGEKERPLLAFAEGPLVGSAVCKDCHSEEHAWWSQDPHGRAMASLAGKVHEGQPADQQVACVRCHAPVKVSGGPPPTTLDGFRLDEGGVGCESCHGPGTAHVQAKGAPGTIEGLGDDCPVCVLEALCTGCHTKAWDPGWDLDARLEQVKHP